MPVDEGMTVREALKLVNGAEWPTKKMHARGFEPSDTVRKLYGVS